MLAQCRNALATSTKQAEANRTNQLLSMKRCTRVLQCISQLLLAQCRNARATSLKQAEAEQNQSTTEHDWNAARAPGLRLLPVLKGNTTAPINNPITISYECGRGCDSGA